MTEQITDRDRRIVVGGDGSPYSKTALRWAMEQARQTDVAVEAVTAWQDPTMYGAGIGYAWGPSAAESDSIAAYARKALDSAIEEVSQHCVQHPPCPVVVVPAETGHAAPRPAAADDAWSRS